MQQGGTAGDSGTVCGTAEVVNIFAESCSQSLCHDAEAPAADLDLTVADPVTSFAGQPGSFCSDALLLDPGSPSTSLLWTKVSDESASCGDSMPVGGTLPASDVDCIESWIVGTDLTSSCETCGGNECIDLQTDSSHCGACGSICASGQICSGGECQGCADGLTACDSGCVDLSTSNSHCGTCGNSCGAGKECVEGQCSCVTSEEISFSQDVVPIFTGSCIDGGCHSGQRPKEELSLEADVSYAELVGVTAVQCSDGRALVEPGAPESSYLMQKILGVDMCSGTVMPKGAPLSLAEVDTISAWICGGAQDN